MSTTDYDQVSFDEGYVTGYQDGRSDGYYDGSTDGFQSGDFWGRRDMAYSAMCCIVPLIGIIILMTGYIVWELMHR